MYRGGRTRIEVAETPRHGLGMMSVEVGDQLVVREVPQAGAVIRYAVGLAREIEGPLLVAEDALMHYLEPQ